MSVRHRFHLPLVVCAFSLVAGALSFAGRAAAHDDVPTPIVTGPVTSPGGAFVTPPSGIDLADFGYVEEEFFVSGTARAHTVKRLGANGKWAARANGETADYTTRILVRRPIARDDFNGTVLVEWLNVSGGLDAAPDWTFLHPLLKRKGYAWVGVSAQLIGIVGSTGPLGLNLGLKAVNPVRYAPLEHPGDSFSYDMFSQVAESLRHPGDVNPLGNLKPRRLIAIGESQSAFRMVTYVNAIHPLAGEFDGFLIHSRGGGAAPLSQPPQPSMAAPTPSFIRTDIDVPVLIFETETDIISLGYFAADQPDEGNIRLWEVTGTAHDDTYGLSAGPGDAGKAALDTTYLPPVTSIFGVINCAKPINAGPQHYVLSAAVTQLDKWVRDRHVRGPKAPRFRISAPDPPADIDRDAFGNARGGIRTPQVDVPIATLSGLGQTGGGFCFLFGTTTPFDAATLSDLYPSHEKYVSAVNHALRKAVHDDFITKTDATAIKAAAKASTIGD